MPLILEPPARSNGSSGGLDLPAWEYQHSGVALQCGTQHLGAFDTQIDAPIFDAGDGCLRDSTQCRQLRLAEALQLTEDSHRLANRDLDAFFGRNVFVHITIQH